MMIEHRPPAMTFFIIASLLCFIAEEGKRRGTRERASRDRRQVWFGNQSTDNIANTLTQFPYSGDLQYTRPIGQISKSWCDSLDGHEERSIHFSWGKYCSEGTNAAEFAPEGGRTRIAAKREVLRTVDWLAALAGDASERDSNKSRKVCLKWHKMSLPPSPFPPYSSFPPFEYSNEIVWRAKRNRKRNKLVNYRYYDDEAGRKVG